MISKCCCCCFDGRWQPHLAVLLFIFPGGRRSSSAVIAQPCKFHCCELENSSTRKPLSNWKLHLCYSQNHRLLAKRFSTARMDKYQFQNGLASCQRSWIFSTGKSKLVGSRFSIDRDHHSSHVSAAALAVIIFLRVSFAKSSSNVFIQTFSQIIDQNDRSVSSHPPLMWH